MKKTTLVSLDGGTAALISLMTYPDILTKQLHQLQGSRGAFDSKPRLMARQSRSTASSTTRAPARASAPAPAAPAHAAPAQSHPPAHAPAPVQTSSVPAMAPMAQPQQPSLFANMASTAAGVAVGSAVGHTLGAGLTSWFGSGSSDTPQAAPQQQQNLAPQQQAQPNQYGAACEADSKAFTNCLEKSSNDISACQFYLDMLKQCQSNQRTFA
ncbi:hypothetical protein CcCBS67573_g01948 [Chytriomyces confervae]|uniref:CHCH domain-containing protein n=1 Tax=Chytriomyces confervae TaxID=246404 RepID=A0A507FKM6_9FUNG|nr:hypothetical protein CcCBS67573_g01948 [Chytriomyces confervae]